MNNKIAEDQGTELKTFEKQFEQSTKEFIEKLKRDFPRINEEILAEIEKTIEGPTCKEVILGFWKKIRGK